MLASTSAALTAPELPGASEWQAGWPPQRQRHRQQQGCLAIDCLVPAGGRQAGRQITLNKAALRPTSRPSLNSRRAAWRLGLAGRQVSPLLDGDQKVTHRRHCVQHLDLQQGQHQGRERCP